MNNENINNKNKIDDSKEIVTIDYFDRINRKWIKLDVTKEVAKFLESNKKKLRRKQNQYNYFNKQIDAIFNESKPENEHFLIDENQDIEKNMELKELEAIEKAEENHKRTLIENSLYELTEKQREVVEKILYENKTNSKIADELNISRQSVGERLSSAKKNIKNHIKNTQN